VLSKLFIKFILVGIINTLFGYFLFSLFIYFGIHYSLAVALSTIGGVLFNFKTLGKLVFNSNNNRLFFKFIFVYLFTYVLNVGIIKGLIHYSVNIYAAGAVATIIAALCSYALNKEFVFKEVCREIH